MKIKRRNQALRNGLMLSTVAALLLSGCASRTPRADPLTFDGRWGVRWCHKSRPDLDCGGFHLTLLQSGDRLCGTYFGARVNLAQIDEGADDSVKGKVVGNKARLTIQSGRNGSVHSATAVILDGRMHWKIGNQVSPPENGDIDILAYDDHLDRESGFPETAARVRSACVASGAIPPN